MALHTLRAAPSCRITALLTTITEGYDRISMHGVRRTLLERQAEHEKDRRHRAERRRVADGAGDATLYGGVQLGRAQSLAVGDRRELSPAYHRKAA